MSGTQTSLTGPDLSEGVTLTAIKEEGMLLGQVAGEAVLLIRRNNEFFALGAHCTHYGAPLHEGCIINNELRCPWHHAAFDLATGAVKRAPALEALKCWDVTVRGDKVYVSKERPKVTSSPKTSQRSDTKHMIIIGAGAAGNAAAEMLRNQDFSGRITMFNAEGSLPYDKPNLSKDYLAGSALEEWITLRGEDFYREKQIQLKLCTEVTAINPASKTVTYGKGESITYDACLIATGAAPIHLQIPGHDLPHVCTLRTFDDCKKIIARAEKGKKVVIIGSGFIGLEAAAALTARGLQVSVITKDSIPLSRVVGEQIGQLLHKTHVHHGVEFYFDRTAKSFQENQVLLDDGQTIDADIVLVGIGVRPRLELAKLIGLELHGGGAKVNSHLESSIPGIYVAGDMACWLDPLSKEYRRVEHWAVAQRQGQIAALNMMGKPESFKSTPFFWTNQYDLALAYIGYAPTWDTVEIQGDLEQRNAVVAYLHAGLIKAVVTLGQDQISLEAEAALERNDQAALRKILHLN